MAALQSLRRRERPGDEQLETPRERQLALIAANWRERNAGAEPSVTILREIRSMLDAISKLINIDLGTHYIRPTKKSIVY